MCYSHFIICPIGRLSDLQSAVASVRPAAPSALCVIGIDVNTLVPAQKAKCTNTSHDRSIHISILICTHVERCIAQITRSVLAHVSAEAQCGCMQIIISRRLYELRLAAETDEFTVTLLGTDRGCSSFYQSQTSVC